MSVLKCEECRKDRRVCDILAPGTFPVYSFGNPTGKRILVVGLNPSKKEYPAFLKPHKDPARRKVEQFSYFKRVAYKHFEGLEAYFERAKPFLGGKLWDKVGYLDLVKCPVDKDGSTSWGDLDDSEREALIGNCEGYLIQQLRLYKPRLVIAHGRDTERWLTRNALPTEARLVYVPQRLQESGPERDRRMREIQSKVAEEIKIALRKPNHRV
jgi:hypothetical protein